MDALFEIDGWDVLGGWTGRRGRRRVASPSAPTTQGIRFAFYGRTSTVKFQDPVTSRAWQREMAEVVIAGRGVITTEFFDVGCSRRVPWERRTEAAALLEQARSADRQFDAVVVGEFERAFTDRQFEQVAGMLRRFGVRVWLPEAGGFMFAQRLAGCSVAGIARELNERGVPCPSAADPGRNRHRSGAGWNLRSVAVILANPRHTGRQVWSRQRSRPDGGRSTVEGEWVVSHAVSTSRW